MSDSESPTDSWSVIVWNLNEGWSHKAESWTILDRLRADISLLAEARTPKEGLGGHVRGGERTLGLDDKVRDWASLSSPPMGSPM